jgi:ribosome-associated protein
MQHDIVQRFEDDLKKRRIPTEIKAAIRTIFDKKGEDITLIKVKGLTSMTDYMLLCTSQSARQNKAIGDAVRLTLRNEFKLKPFGVEGNDLGDWILIDYVDFVLHLFLGDVRRKYDLEKMWMDAKRYQFAVD